MAASTGERTMPPTITALYAGLLALFVVALAGRVANLRFSTHQGLGDGDDVTLRRAVRVHGNAIENIPLALLLLLLAELLGLPPNWLHAFGIAIVVGRLLHAFGLSRHSGYSRGRFFGIGVTWIAISTMAVVLIAKALGYV
jgi:uncharacterized membrane protein YecN with MAPEG domain